MNSIRIHSVRIMSNGTFAQISTAIAVPFYVVCPVYEKRANRLTTTGKLEQLFRIAKSQNNDFEIVRKKIEILQKRMQVSD